MAYAQWGTFASIALFCLGGSLLVLLAWAFAWGFGIGTNWVVSTATLQKLAPDRFRGRLSAIDAMLFTAGMALSALIGAAAVDYSGVAAASGWTGLVIGVVGWFAVKQFIARPRIYGGSLCATPAGD